MSKIKKILKSETSSIKNLGKKTKDDIADKIAEGKDTTQDTFEHAAKEVKEATKEVKEATQQTKDKANASFDKVKSGSNNLGDMVKDKMTEVAVDYTTNKTKNIFLKLIEKLIEKLMKKIK